MDAPNRLRIQHQGGTSTAQATDRTDAEIRALLEEWVSAERAGDAPALDRLLADDFVGVGLLGFVLTKPQWLARYTGGGLKYDAFALDEARSRGTRSPATARSRSRTRRRDSRSTGGRGCGMRT